jgi:hypothetical protein
MNTIFISGIRLDEPVIALTDLVLSVLCFYFFLRLSRLAQKQALHRYLLFYFFSVGIATGTGGIINHGLLYMFDPDWRLVCLLTSLVSIALIERVSLEYARKLLSLKTYRILSILNIVGLLTFIVLTLVTMNFFMVGLYFAYGILIIVGMLNIHLYTRTRDPGSRQFLFAVGFSTLTALVYLNKWSLHQWFNYLAVSHVLMIFATVFFYRGARLIMHLTKHE